MRPPCEIVQREFLPTLRAKVAHELRGAGLSQNEIATKMDLTQAAVSKYLAQSKVKSELSNEVSTTVPKIVALLNSTVTYPDKIVMEICSACMKSRIGASICQLHKKNIPSLKIENCQICSHLLGGQDEVLTERAHVISDMQDAIHQIESNDYFKLIMPQVRANLVCAESTASNIDQIAGIPGRITIIDGRARVLMSPQFGASKHTARLLLYAKSKWPNVHACLCISGRKEVVDIAEESGFNVISLESATDEAEKIIEVLEKRKIRKNLKLPAIHVPGGIGVEPILYLFGSSAVQLSNQSNELCTKLNL